MEKVEFVVRPSPRGTVPDTCRLPPDALQLGGKRNYGYGTTRMNDTQVVDLEALDYPRLEDGEAFLLELVTPFVLRSESPATNNVDVPGWWSVDDEAQLRHRLEKVVEGGDIFELETIDQGVVVGYEGDRPVETAISGVPAWGTTRSTASGSSRSNRFRNGGQIKKVRQPEKVIRLVIVR